MSVPRLSRSLARLPLLDAAHVSCSRYSVTIRSLATEVPSSALDDSPSSSTSRTPAVDQRKLTHLKRRTRGGQNLTKRFKRLERAVRGKASYGRDIQELERSSAVPDPAPYTEEESTQQASSRTDTGAGTNTRRIFRGFFVPEPPKPPADDECCMSGCAVCVYDLYDEARQDYIQAIDTLRAELSKQGVEKSEWPADIRGDVRDSDPTPAPRSSASVTLSAFEQLELALKAKRERDTSRSSTNVAQVGSEG
ncbi:hypothetical protein BD311DRAFT_656785 [Dichomitus squalens]|uniref:Oxidoreductase-like domain-containing protein n=1 Tax=Dichomitus squalens TaxID=114155 RepID=A0A4Q9MU34_9APHY|nr:hypothetical protein BD311DRAFT_656785 [Dichomitus squalens]TBU61112.1 hypothetical protein BD310DRAFT_946848 [Dichomitus squalens]